MRFLAILLILLPLRVFAQYHGGPGSGFAQKSLVLRQRNPTALPDESTANSVYPCPAPDWKTIKIRFSYQKADIFSPDGRWLCTLDSLADCKLGAGDYVVVFALDNRKKINVRIKIQ